MVHRNIIQGLRFTKDELKVVLKCVLARRYALADLLNQEEHADISALSWQAMDGINALKKELELTGTIISKIQSIPET